MREVTDDKSKSYDERKRLQIVNAPYSSLKAKYVKLADKLYNLRSMDAYIPVGWDKARAKKYAEWSREVVSQIKGINEPLDKALDEVIERCLKKYSWLLLDNCLRIKDLFIMTKIRNIGGLLWI